MTARVAALSIVALASAAMCGDDSVSPDAGMDTATDTTSDVVVDVPSDQATDVVGDVLADSTRDAGPALWTRMPMTPDFCDVEYAMQPGSALAEIGWAPCPAGPSDECSILEYDTGFRTSRENVTLTHSPAAAAQPLFELAQASDEDGGTKVSIQLVDPSVPAVLAAWRYTFGTELCARAHSATDSDHLGFEVRLPSKESLFFRTRIDALPAMPDEPIGRLTEAEQPGAVATQDMQISPSTLGVVLQPGAVLWLFEDGLQMRRGGPLETGVPGAVLNQFSIVDRRIYWAVATSLVLAEALDAPSESLSAPPDTLIRTPEADHEFVTWQHWDGDARAELWAASVPPTAAEITPFLVASFTDIATLGLGDGLVARNTALDRIRLYDLRGGAEVREYALPLGWRMDDDFLWVNRTDVGISVEREGATLFSTVMRIPIESFEPL